MKELIEFSLSENNEFPLRPVEVISGMSQIGLILRGEKDGKVVEYLYRPERGVILTLDNRVPKPQELYRDVAYHKVDRMLGWGLTAPVVPWKLNEGDCGVLRPYWREAKNIEIYRFNKESLRSPKDFWLRVAALDYICGVVDRRRNDFLVVDGKPLVVDSGLSFVTGTDFTFQSSLVRETFLDEKLPKRILRDIKRFKNSDFGKNLSDLIGQEEIDWVVKRAEKVLKERRIV